MCLAAFFSSVVVRRRSQPSGPARLRYRSHHPARHEQRDENDNRAKDHPVGLGSHGHAQELRHRQHYRAADQRSRHDAAPPITSISTTLSEVSSVKVVVGSM